MKVALHPNDEFNRRLQQNVHPPDWVNPTPDGRYNLVVVGAGTAGLVTAAVAAGLGARVALVERHLMGGDCLNVGCVPSKGLLRAARAWAAATDAGEFGLRLPTDADRDFSTAMTRMRRLRAELSHVDSAARFRDLGVDVYIGAGRFTGPDTVVVGETVLRFARAAICTGARAAAPPIAGLEAAGYLTNETVFSLTALPTRLAVIGAGPIGCELAQAFARFGSVVTLLEQAAHILPREDRDAADIVDARLRRDGVQIICGSAITGVSSAAGAKQLRLDGENGPHTVVADEILVGVGRAPNVEGLGLAEAGVASGPAGVEVDDYLRTSNRRVYAAGDVCSSTKFTHAADAMAQIVIQNALFPHPCGLGRASTSALIMPWCTYTEPEIAHVGLYAAEAEARGIRIETFTQSLSEVDRAVLDGAADGFARVHVKHGTDTIVGATIVATDAGNMISEVTLAMKTGAGLGAIGATIHPYPTQADALRKVAHQWRRSRFSDRQRRTLRTLFTWSR